MFPGVDGFHWTVGHVVFLSLFFAMALTIVGTLGSAAWRTVKDFRDRSATDLCWKADFVELPEADRRCRHELAGRVISRACENQFDCRHCENYSHFAVLPARGHTRDLGLDYPEDRMYHRGHTWVKVQPDGTVDIGLDALADHMIGRPDFVRLPRIGEELDVNQIAWRIKKNGKEILVRAPVEGTVVGASDGLTLKLHPRLDVHDPANLRHLLRGPEMHGWVSRELERLQVQLRAPGTQPSLADGGVLVHGLIDALPDADWDTVLADTFLQA
jgi:glycine cleavage system H lipoate-binding protein